MNAPRVRLVVLNYNGGGFVIRCLEHLGRLDWPRDRLEVVVVDNASSDGSDQVIDERFPEVTLVRNPRNTGFSANNLGLRDLDGFDYVGLVNNDSFVEPGWLAPLVAALEADPALGAASARMLFADRFVEIEMASPTFVPGPADRRSLGVRVGGARVAGKDRWRDTHFPEGAWGIEHDGQGGTFQWTSDRTVVRVPVAPDGAAATGGEPAVTGGESAAAEATGAIGARGVPVELCLQAEAAKEVIVRSGGAEATVTVGVEPGWVTVPAGGEPIDVVNNAGSIVLVDGSGADRGYLEADRGQYDEPADVFAWCGGSVLFRPAYLADIGLFDERFFLYYEDTDMSWRGAARGWRYRYVPEAVARHMHAASTGEGTRIFQHYVERNRLLMLTKNAPAGLAARAVGRFVLVTLSYARRDILRPLLGRHRPQVEQVRRRLGSLAGYLRLLPGALIERRRLRRAARVPDGDLLARLVTR